MRILPAAFALLVASALAPSSCGSAKLDCSNGTCVCASSDTCDLTCNAPPCHVDCGAGSHCKGTCANAECICEANAACQFACGAPPCHVDCKGNNSTCDGTCANGTCACGAGSVCHFTCASGPCHTTCAAGAKCLVTCPNSGLAGTQDCDVSSCAAGTPTTCADGLHIACGMPCPT